MRHLILLILCSSVLSSSAQNAATLIAELKAINTNVSGTAEPISHRAMSIFMADKTGYLSGNTDLSYYTNYATFNSAEGRITVNHNFQQASTGVDDPIKALFSAGLDMVLASSYTKGFLDNRFENQLGISLNYKWLGSIKTRFSDNLQKQLMDAMRIALLQSLINEIANKEADFTTILAGMDSTALPGQNIASVKTNVQQNFYNELRYEYEEKFASLQAVLLSKTSNFKTITTGWTSITAYLPLVFPGYTTAASFTANFISRHPYAAYVSLEHTRLWETGKGRLFLTGTGRILFNNAKLSYRLSKLNFSEYKSLGGSAGQTNADPGNEKLYIGDYQTFVTPSISARAVYFPRESHVGISLLAEQNFGTYQILNLRLAIPVVLINSKKTPAVNIECYVLFLDCSNRLVSNPPGKTQLGLSVGIPFSRLMF